LLRHLLYTHFITRLRYLSPTDPASPEPSPLSLHDALPISRRSLKFPRQRQRASTTPVSLRARATATRCAPPTPRATSARIPASPDRKSTRLNSSHLGISYAVFCLKKKISNSLIRTLPPRYG